MLRVFYIISISIIFGLVDSKSYFPLGGNLGGAIDWVPSAVFVNHLDNMRRMGSANAPWDGTGMTFDKYGNPQQDFGLYLLGVNSEPQETIGNWSISFTGTGTISCSNGPQIPYQHYNATTNKVSAIMTVYKGQWTFWCSVRGTNGTTTDIKWIRPGYDINDYPTFTKSYLAQFPGWNTFRFMDWFGTNGNTLVNWADHPSLLDAQNIRGYAYDFAIELCNTLNTNAWINIPSNATDDYVTQMATLFKNKLNPNLILYVEYSNELWNFIFPQAHWSLSLAEEEVAANASSNLNWDNGNNKYYWAFRRQFTRPAEISKIFRSIYGDCAMGKTVRVVGAAQFVGPYMFQDGLNTVNRNYGDPSQYLSACAGAPYFDLGPYGTSNNVTLDQVLEEFVITSQSFNKTYLDGYGVCRYYGLDYISYEGGPATYPATNPYGFRVAGNASMDDRMQPIVENFLKTWFNSNLGLFMYYNFGVGSQYSQYGAWDVAFDAFNYSSSPKWRAVENVRDNFQLPAAPTIGHMLPSNSVGVLSPARISSNSGYMLLINSPTTYGANYSISTLNISCYTGFQIQIWVNNKVVFNMSEVPCTGRYATYNSTNATTNLISLPPGVSTIWFPDARVSSVNIVLNNAATSRVFPAKEPIFYDADPCLPSPPPSASTSATSATSATSELTGATTTGVSSGSIIVLSMFALIACVLTL